MKTYEKAIITLLGIIAASLFVIAGCLFYLALHLSAYAPNAMQKTTAPTTTATACVPCCPPAVTKAIKPVKYATRPAKKIRRVVIKHWKPVAYYRHYVKPIRQNVIKAVTKPKIAIKTSVTKPQAVVIAVKKKPAIKAKAKSAIKKETATTTQSEWNDCAEPKVFPQRSCKLTPQQEHYIVAESKGKITITQLQKNRAMNMSFCEILKSSSSSP